MDSLPDRLRFFIFIFEQGATTMIAKRELEAEVRAIVRAEESPDQTKALSALIDIRINQFGNFIFVRKGAPVDLNLVGPEDRVHVDDIYDVGRVAKRKQYLKLKNDPKYHGPMILAEGDSWFEYPFAKDLIKYAGEEYAVLSLARAGDTWSNIIQEDSDPELKYPDGTPMGLLHTLRLPDPKPFEYVMLSAGGDDLIGDLRFCVYNFDPSRSEDDYIKHGGANGFDSVLGLALADYKLYIDKIIAMGKSVILHTYDYPNPKSGGQYIGYPLEHYCKFPAGSVGLMRRTVNHMIDFFHDGLAKIAKASPGKVHLIDLRNTIGTNDFLNGPDQNLWADEMHGNDQGFSRLWKRMDRDLKKIF